MPRTKRKHKLAAEAFRDAVRHILQTDDEFMMHDQSDRDLVWCYDGLRWRGERLASVDDLLDAPQPAA